MKHAQETDFPSRLKHGTFSTWLSDRWREIKGECRESHSRHNVWFVQLESKTFLTKQGKNYSGAKQEINGIGEQKTAKCV